MPQPFPANTCTYRMRYLPRVPVLARSCTRERRPRRMISQPVWSAVELHWQLGWRGSPHPKRNGTVPARKEKKSQHPRPPAMHSLHMMLDVTDMTCAGSCLVCWYPILTIALRSKIPLLLVFSHQKESSVWLHIAPVRCCIRPYTTCD